MIGLLSDLHPVTVHAGKRFKALIDSGAGVSLACTSVYNMIAWTIHIKTADESSMSSLGKATSQLHIANFKFLHTFIICDKLPETGIYLA